MPLAENRKRARSDAEKKARKAVILAAARAMIGKDGFEGVTMNELARRADLSKGTLYLYVRSKEELFLALFENALEDLVVRIESEADAANLLEVMARAPQEVPLFLPLLARLMSVIDINVADEPLFAAKRRMFALGARVGEVIANLTGAPHEEARDAASVLMLAMQGAAQSDLSAQRDPATIPDDLKPAYAAHAFARRFPAAVRLILGPLFQNATAA